MAAFYNEIDPYAAQWLRNLIAAGHIAPGVVDERSIEDIDPNELRQYTQVHFFAGIGVWSRALRLAGWPDDRRVWTGSCPCQPFSAAGKGDGFADERHLWPAFHWLISQCRPSVVFGEQVASKDGLEWLDLVQADLEGSGYATGAADLCAAGVGAPHIRQRLYWVADASGLGCQRLRDQPAHHQPVPRCSPAAGQDGVDGGQADSGVKRRQQEPGGSPCDEEAHGGAGRDGQQSHGHHIVAGDGEIHGPSPTNGHWRDADWLFCRDGKWRPVEPGTFPLAHGAPARVGRLRAYGNAIVPQVAQAFIEAYLGR